MKYMRIKCIECEKEAEEMRQLEEELFVCEDCYDTVSTGILNILNYMENKLNEE